MKVLLIEGPFHRQVLDLSWVTTSTMELTLQSPNDDSTRPSTTQQYLRERPEPDDMTRGIEARFRWAP